MLVLFIVGQLMIWIGVFAKMFETKKTIKS